MCVCAHIACKLCMDRFRLLFKHILLMLVEVLGVDFFLQVDWQGIIDS